MYYIYPDIYYFYIALPLFLMFQQISSGIISLLSKELPLATVQNKFAGCEFSGFSFTGECLCFTFIYEDYFLLDTEFWVDFFSFSTLKMLCHCGRHSFWGKIHSHLNNHSPIDNMLFFSGCFQVFCLQKFVFRSLTMICLCVDFFLRFSCLGLLDFLNLQVFVFQQIWKFFINYYFQHHVLCPLLQGFQ